MSDYEDIDWLRAHGSDIRVHGNGFLQLDLPGNQRLHVWQHPALPRQVSATPIHDHAWHMQSEVLRGRIVNVLWRFVSSALPNDMVVYSPAAREGQDTELVPTGDRGRVQLLAQPNMVQAGQSYSMAAGILHETWLSVPAVTLIRKTMPPLVPRQPPVRVLCPHGRLPDNEFHRYDYEPERLWSILKDALQ